MPYSVTVEPQSGIGIVTARDELTAVEIERALQELWGTPGYKGNDLWDLRNGSLAELTQSDVQRIISFLERERPALPIGAIAYVAVRDVDFGVARMFQSLVPDISGRSLVTRDFEHALAWVRGLSE